ncbi:MerR family transcriptional regulator [Actinoplanes sp. Pm04-4]|uniref:MerR family transcriptional regulator n=1 Tax=Paractinoplanes pyxinae TaxID=2997416 RepID=A0ABT4B4N4_9ACTN|nr:MerR family transcriptional regulator [Actinoplanes pyxinae]MCY1141453.1 MerR family transcriptional regulator [Actinoplanes pyxinae]
MSIGDFARMTLLSVKTLRRYQELHVLEPAAVDPFSGYRYYSAAQVPVAQVVRRFRDLGMPLAELRDLVNAPDLAARNRTIAAHLQRMEDQLDQTRATVASLRRLMQQPPPAEQVSFRTVPASWALAARARVGEQAGLGWVEHTHQQLRSALTALGGHRAGPDSATFAPELFESDEGEIVAYLPTTDRLEATHPDVEVIQIPAGEYAVVLHDGPVADLDQAYAALGRVVAERSLGVAGPLREHYLVSALDTSDEARHRTEVGWPVFRTAATE